MNTSRRWMFAVSLLFTVSVAVASCADEQGKCSTECIHTCIDDLDLCGWHCDQQSAGTDCYRSCVIVVDECALACEDK